MLAKEITAFSVAQEMTGCFQEPEMTILMAVQEMTPSTAVKAQIQFKLAQVMTQLAHLVDRM